MRRRCASIKLSLPKFKIIMKMHKNVALCEMRKYPICKELSDICVVTQRSYRLGTTDRASNICGNFSRKQSFGRFLLKRTKFESGSRREGGRGCKR